MSRPLRSKRNFKALQLDVSNPPPPPPEPDPVPVPIRLAPASKQGLGGGKKRPPPMNLKPKVAADTPPVSDSSAVDGVVAIAPAPSSAPATGGTPSAGAKRMTYHTTLSNTLASLDLNAEVKYDLRDEDLKDLHELGQGNGGSVKKVEHVPSRTIMAKKVCLPCLRALPTWPLPLDTRRAYRVPADRAH
jgi:mitogen-activated protein kinase kinase